MYNDIFKQKIYAIIVTNDCNLRCRYCYSGNSIRKEKMSKITAQKVITHIIKDAQFLKLNKIHIIFEGNEPLLNQNILIFLVKSLENECLKYKLVVEFSIFSNLQAMTLSILKFIVEHEISIHSSLDGPEWLHDSLRGKGSFQKVTSWINLFKKVNINLSVSAVVVKQSLNYVQDILKVYKGLGLKSINIRALHSLGFAKKSWKELGYSSKEFIDFWKKAVKYCLHLSLNGKSLYENKAIFIYNKIVNNQEKTFLFSPPCNGVSRQLCYGPEGNIYTCDEGRGRGPVFKIGNVEKGIINQKQSAFYKLIKN
ncbi:MAG: radical SAM protein, partial [Candidatus Margulisbacteria bacterium]|nr:radical SAM protein [Candidatus Margulisiibacteriota bacterium]